MVCRCGECHACKHRAYMAEWRLRPGNPEKTSAWAKDWYRRNADLRRAQERKRRQDNLDEMREKDRARARRQQQRYKANAHLAVVRAVKRGDLVPEDCETCGLSATATDHHGRRLVHGHHSDYSKPLDVRWLCPACHGIEHRRVA